jgi:hypothetical protein
VRVILRILATPHSSLALWRKVLINRNSFLILQLRLPPPFSKGGLEVNHPGGSGPSREKALSALSGKTFSQLLIKKGNMEER